MAFVRNPRQKCLICGREQQVRHDARGYPPKIAENELRRACAAAGCPCSPQYTAGLIVGPPPHGQ